MYRKKLVNFRGHLKTQDTVEALERLLVQLDENKWKPVLIRPSADIPWEAASLAPAGREVQLRVEHPEADDQTCLEALWGHAVPMGFTPWLRYPQQGVGTAVFHYFGPWQVLFDNLLEAGRGHLAWPSLCAAAQCDIGTWKGDKADNRFLQAQLHRVGFSCGPVDGVVGPMTLRAVTAAGLKSMSSQQMLEHLSRMEPPQAPRQARQIGHLALPGRKLVIHTTGSVKATQTTQGASLAVDGAGQLIVEIGERND